MDNICVNCNEAITDTLGGGWIHTDADRRSCAVDGAEQAEPAVANIDWASI